MDKFEQAHLNKYQQVWTSLDRFKEKFGFWYFNPEEFRDQNAFKFHQGNHKNFTKVDSLPATEFNCSQFYMCNHDKLFMYCRALWWYKWVWLIAALFLVLQQFYDDKNDFFYGWQSRFWPKKAQYRHKRDCRNRERKKKKK